MKTTEEKIAIMQAYAEGKKIEYKVNGHDEYWAQWVIQEEPQWDWGWYDYRIKPEPHYRPYANAEECFKDVLKHGGWIKNTSGQYIHILAVGESAMAYAENISFPYERACQFWVWADDNSPCGVKEE